MYRKQNEESKKAALASKVHRERKVRRMLYIGAMSHMPPLYRQEKQWWAKYPTKKVHLEDVRKKYHCTGC